MYSRELLRLALRLAKQARLSDPHGSAERRSRTCGSAVIVDVGMDGERVAAFGQDVRACAVGQASAAVLGSHAVGLTRQDLSDARDKLSNYVKGLSDDLPMWPEIAALGELRDYPARHAAALLPYDAALAAIDRALSASRNAATSDNSTSVATNA